MSELIEIWKPIMGYEGVYEISNHGNVKSLDRWVKTGRGGLQFREGKMLKPKIDKYGYLTLGLCKKGKSKWFTIHRLVAIHFISNPDNLPQVNHKDEDKTNNMVWVNEDGSIDYDKSNLEWCTNEYNNNYGTRNKRIKDKQVNDKKKSKPVIQLTLNNEIIGLYLSINEATRQTGVASSDISKCCYNKSHHKSAGCFKWRDLNVQLADWLEEIQDEDMVNEKVA